MAKGGKGRDRVEKTMRVGLYARVSTHDQQTLPMQLSAMREYAERRGWEVVKETSEVGSGAKEREKREERLFRRLYDTVRRDRDKSWHEDPDKVEAFSMDTQPYEEDVETMCETWTSASILAFYGAISLVIVLAGIARALLPA